MRILATALLLLTMATPALAQLDVGDPAPTPDLLANLAGDNILTATGTVRFYGSTNGLREVDVACSGSATFYLYDFDGSGNVRRVYGPYYTRAWAPIRSPIASGWDADMLHLVELAPGAEFIITPSGQ